MDAKQLEIYVTIPGSAGFAVRLEQEAEAYWGEFVDQLKAEADHTDETICRLVAERIKGTVFPVLMAPAGAPNDYTDHFVAARHAISAAFDDMMTKACISVRNLAVKQTTEMLSGVAALAVEKYDEAVGKAIKPPMPEQMPEEPQQPPQPQPGAPQADAQSLGA